MDQDQGDLVKVCLEHDDGEFESLWAKQVGPSLYELDNTPFFTYNVSAGDIVEVEEEEGRLYAVRVAEKVGSRTLRVYLPKQEGGIHGPKGRTVSEMLVELGCWHEGFQPALLAIDVPAHVDLGHVTARLTAMEVQWEYGDPQPGVDGFWRKR